MRKILWLLIFIGANVAAQPFQELTVGSKFPDYELKNMLNYPKKTLNLKDYRGKLVILDFWATTCGSCVNAWPKMLSLQKEFAGKIQIILVSKFETKEVVKEFVDKRKKFVDVDMTLPMACRDTTLKQLFPASGVPRYYWLDGNGVLHSITDGPEVNSKNIAAWLEKGPQKLPQLVKYHRAVGNEPLFVDGNGGEGNADKFVWSSILTKGVRNLTGSLGMYTGDANYYGFRSSGMNIRSLYATAYNPGNLDSTYFPTFLIPNEVQILVKDTLQFNYMLGDTVNVEKLYCYQLIAGRKVTRAEILKMMQDDLRRYFGFKVSWEKVRKKCLVWTIDDLSKVQNYHGTDTTVYMNDAEASFESVTVFQAIRFMKDGTNYMFSPYPFFDETNYKGLLKLRFNCNCLDWKSLAECFRKHGMNLKLEDREVEVLTLRDP